MSAELPVLVKSRGCQTNKDLYRTMSLNCAVSGGPNHTDCDVLEVQCRVLYERSLDLNNSLTVEQFKNFLNIF